MKTQILIVLQELRGGIDPQHRILNNRLVNHVRKSRFSSKSQTYRNAWNLHRGL